MELSQKLKQVQTLSPKMIESLEILQMGTRELQEYIDELLLENPVMETESHNDEALPEQLLGRFNRPAADDTQNRQYTRQDAESDCDPLSFMGVSGESETLYFFLRSQVDMDHLPCRLANILDYMMQSLNRNGWLDETKEETLALLQIDEAAYDQALRILHSLSPTGIGARNLRECLLLQLRHIENADLATAIVENHLAEMRQNQYHSIAQATGASRAEIQQACDLIRSLNPRPGAGFAERDCTTHYIVPDVAVVRNDSRFEAVPLNSTSPVLKCSSYYSRLWSETTDDQVKDYLSEKLKQAQWVIRSIDQRKTMLLRCTEYIAERQEDFFRYGKGRLRPLLLRDAANQLGVHESTVSRTIRNKYLQCSFGVFPLSYFFSRAYSDRDGGELSADGVKAAIRKLIDSEDRSKPLSDAKLQEMLQKQGAEVSRRTIAKYREELGIPSSVGRKQFV